MSTSLSSFSQFGTPHGSSGLGGFAVGGSPRGGGAAGAAGAQAQAQAAAQAAALATAAPVAPAALTALAASLGLGGGAEELCEGVSAVFFVFCMAFGHQLTGEIAFRYVDNVDW